jgi:uncharacterized repeat protein (TIGR01451 family)
MTGRYAIAGLALVAILALWAAPAGAQPDQGKMPAEPEVPAPPGPPTAGPPLSGLPGLPSAPLPGPAAPMPAPPLPPSTEGRQAGAQPQLPAVPSSPEGHQAATPRPTAGPDGSLPAVEEHPADTDQAGQNGKQEPSVSLEWVGPSATKLGMATDYSVVVRNTCAIPVQQVLVRVRLPAGMSCGGTEPRAVAENNVLVWDVGTLLPKQEKSLAMKIQAENKGDLTPQAWVTFTGSSLMHVVIREPKLHLRASATDKVLVGDTVSFSLTVTNPGDGPAEQVKIQATLSEGLEHPKGNRVEVNVGKLNPAETRSIQVICAARSGGPQKCDGVAMAEGGLHAEASADVNVIMPRLEMQLVGPALRYLDRKATYTVKVTNPGDAPTTNVSVTAQMPGGFKFTGASDGGQHDFNARTISWFLGEIGPAQTREVKFEAMAISPGDHKFKATATAARGLTVEGECVTKVEGVSALLTEVVDTEDPIEVGAGTTYEIRITNTGSKTENDIKLLCTVPEKMQFVSAQGPCKFAQEGSTVIFEPLAKLTPRADAIFRVQVKGVQAGVVRFKIQVTSASIPDPIVRMESTTIYSDSPDGK